ncbi:MAG: DUF177 domain-containing protein [Deltaproteobacteria bacterium]|nr:DUF177 domain-containing protein [Deltaproteobacteria bacterium]
MTRLEKGKAGTRRFVVDVRAIRAGDSVFDRDIPLDWLASELSCCDCGATPLHGRVRLELTPCGTGVLLRGEAAVRLRAECAACLAEVFLDISAPITSYLMPVEEAREQQDAEDLTPEDLEREWFDGDEIVLDDLIRDGIVLEMPMNISCGPACPGLAKALVPIEERSIDPRLAPLKGIKIAKEH